MVGSATFTMVRSSMTMSCAAPMIARARSWRRWVSVPEAAWRRAAPRLAPPSRVLTPASRVLTPASRVLTPAPGPRQGVPQALGGVEASGVWRAGAAQRAEVMADQEQVPAGGDGRGRCGEEGRAVGGRRVDERQHDQVET